MIMRPLFSRLSLAVLLPAMLFSAGAAAAGFVDDFVNAFENGRTRHALEIENDSLLLRRDDGFYTSGIRYVQQYLVADGKDGRDLAVFGWRLGQELYTSMNINLPPERVVPPDHPYAGWLYAGAYKHLHRADGSGWQAGLDLGCLGPCAGGEWTQTNLHRVINQPLPQGWSRQVKNEWGAVLYGEFTPVRWAPAGWLDAAPSVHGRFGNIFTDAGAGFLVRAGRLNVLPDQPTLHAYVRLDGKAVAYDATLQGGYFSSGNPHTVTPKRFVGEAEIGAVWVGKSFSLSAGVVRRSNEIRDLPNSIGAQNFAKVSISYTH